MSGQRDRPAFSPRCAGWGGCRLAHYAGAELGGGVKAITPGTRFGRTKSWASSARVERDLSGVGQIVDGWSATRKLSSAECIGRPLIPKTLRLCSVGDGIIATDRAGEIVFMNPVAEKLTGWRGQEAHGRLLNEVLALLEELSGQPAQKPISDLSTGESRSYRLVPRNGADTLVEVLRFENRSLASSMPIPPTGAIRSWPSDPTSKSPFAAHG